MRSLTLILVLLIGALQYPLWIGKGSWLRVWDVDRQIQQQKEINKKLQMRNTSLEAEVRDLKQGYEAIEERARSELGMIKKDEIFFQILGDPVPAAQINTGPPSPKPTLTPIKPKPPAPKAPPKNAPNPPSQSPAARPAP